MNASKLEQNLTGVIVEMALKMGLSRAPLSLNYPCASLARMLDVPAGPQAVKAALDAFFAARTGLFGAVRLKLTRTGSASPFPPRAWRAWYRRLLPRRFCAT